MDNTVKEILETFESMYNKRNVEGMARFGIDSSKAYGVSMPFVRSLAKQIGRNHQLAFDLWDTGRHEPRILATLVADPKLLTREEMDRLVSDFYSWDVCDQCCMNLFRYSPLGYEKVFEYHKSESVWTRRTAFTLMATLASGDKKRDDNDFCPFFDIIKEHSTDERNFVKKAINWALRQIGKRSLYLHPMAVVVSEELKNLDNKTARWIGSDAYRELTSEKIISRLK